MAIANLHETIQASILRRNQLNLELTELQSRKSLATYEQADLQSQCPHLGACLGVRKYRVCQHRRIAR